MCGALRAPSLANHPLLTQVLAVPVVVFTSFVVGLTIYYGFPFGWDMSTSLLFGSMMSATDPVVSMPARRGRECTYVGEN